MKRFGITSAFYVVFGLTGCVAQQTERAPPLECQDDSGNCLSGNNVSGGISGGASGGTSGVGGSADNTAGSTSAVTVTGQIVELDEPTFSVSEAFSTSGSFKVIAPGVGGTEVSAIVNSSFTLDGVKTAKTLWLSASPTSNNDQFSGLIALDTTSSAKVWVPVVRKSSLELIASVLTLPVTLNSSDGQLVLRFVDGNGAGVSGVKVSVSGAENIAYDTGSSYTDDSFAGTGKRGLAFLLNVDAGATPAAKYVSLSGAVTAEFAVWVQSGAATALELTVSEN